MPKMALAPVEPDPEELSYDGLFAATPDPTVILDARRGSIVNANAAAARLFGIPRPALGGMPLAALLDSNSAVVLRAALETARAAGVAQVGNVRFRGCEKYQSAHFSLIHSGASSYILAHFRGDGVVSNIRSLVFDAIDSGTLVLAVTDANLNLSYANRLCLRLLGAQSLEDLWEQPLGRWIEFPEHQLERLRRLMRSREMATVITGRLTARHESLHALALAIPDETRSLWAFSISAHSRIN